MNGIFADLAWRATFTGNLKIHRWYRINANSTCGFCNKSDGMSCIKNNDYKLLKSAVTVNVPLQSYVVSAVCYPTFETNFMKTKIVVCWY